MLELVDRPLSIDRVALEAAQRATSGDVTPNDAAACGCSYAPPTRTGDSPVASARYACVFKEYAVAVPAGLSNLFVG